MRVRRVIAGVCGSAGSLQALRYAAELAREQDATLVPVLVWTPPGGEMADRRYPNPALRAVWQESAWERLWQAVDLAIGGPPASGFEPHVVRGLAGQVLTSAAADEADVLVIGAGRPGVLGRLASKVSRYCVAHAGCPVICVPPSRLAVQMHGWHGWVLRHRIHLQNVASG